MALRIIPLLLFLALAGFFGFRLLQIDEDPNSGKDIPSPLIGKPAPEFELPDLQDPTKTFARADLLGQVSLVVVWASWCPSCRDEAELLNYLHQQRIVRILGLNYKDQADDARRWLTVFGDPYELNGVDLNGRVGVDWGVYGAPESFLVDKKGIIRDKFIGAISPKDFQERLLPKIHELQAEAG